MYVDGDGVICDDFEVFKMYSDIVGKGIEFGLVDIGYFINVLMVLVYYYLNGILGSFVKVDLFEVCQFYFQVVFIFGVLEVQFQFVKMIFFGQGGKFDLLEVMKWLNYVCKKGYVGVIVFFGSLLFQQGQIVCGFVYMIVVFDYCEFDDKIWVQDLQEQVFFVVIEDQCCSVM